MEDLWVLCSGLFLQQRGVSDSFPSYPELFITGLAFGHLCLISFLLVVCAVLSVDLSVRLLVFGVSCKGLCSGWAGSVQRGEPYSGLADS